MFTLHHIAASDRCWDPPPTPAPPTHWGKRFVCVCVCVWLGWGCGRYRETIAEFGAPHDRPCAVDYHTAVRMRSRQKQHDSPPPPHTQTHTLWLHTRQSNYTVSYKERKATRYCSPLPSDPCVLGVGKRQPAKKNFLNNDLWARNCSRA